MAQRNRLTNNSDEADIASLISGDTIFSIPYFQRAYKWKSERLRQLNIDLLALVDESIDFHFLGAMIVHGRRSNPSDPDVYEVIDGQQRVTTLFLYLCAAVKQLCVIGEHAEAAALFLKYLVINRDTGALSNFKIHSCKDDRSQLNFVFADLLSDAKLVEKLGGFALRPLPNTGAATGTLRNNYRYAIRFFKDEFQQGKTARVRAIYTNLLNKMSVVQIDVWDPTNGPKIFDSLNSRQEPMTIGDLVRNEIFSRVADRHPDVIERVDSEHWQPFYKKFDQGGRNLFDAYFFPFGLVKNPNLKKSEVYTFLRKDWESHEDPAKIVIDLSEFQDSFIDIVIGSNISGHPKGFAGRLRRLHFSGLPTSTYPFLMQLCNGLKNGRIDEVDASAILDIIESFLVRRAVCGHEPTGLHAVFKRLWSDIAGDLNARKVAMEIAKHKTVAWPSNEDFKNAVSNRPLYESGITGYVIIEYDRSLKGDVSESVRPWLEHVLPENPVAAWFDVFSKKQHLEYKDLLANLIPLSSEMNVSLGNREYSVKRKRYREDSMYKSARKFGEKYEQWTPKLLKARGGDLAEWAVSHWYHVPDTFSDSK